LRAQKIDLAGRKSRSESDDPVFAVEAAAIAVREATAPLVDTSDNPSLSFQIVSANMLRSRRKRYEVLARRWRELARSIERDDRQGPAGSITIDQLNASNDD
jgi:hypothetical protein